MARQSSNRTSNGTGEVSPAELLPPGMHGAFPESPESRAAEQSHAGSGEVAQRGIDPEVRHRMISEAAYRRYAQRGFVEGFDLEDWLAAEAEVDRQLGERSTPLLENE